MSSSSNAPCRAIPRSAPCSPPSAIAAPSIAPSSAPRSTPRDGARATHATPAPSSKKTEHGREVAAAQWSMAEFEALRRMWELGAPVPYPVQVSGTEVLMEFIGSADGAAAPRLAQVRHDPALLADLFAQVADLMRIFARAGLAHGDLSPYNLLVHEGRVVVIDLPQIVDTVGQPAGAGPAAPRLRQRVRLVRPATPGRRRRRIVRRPAGGVIRRMTVFHRVTADACEPRRPAPTLRGCPVPRCWPSRMARRIRPALRRSPCSCDGSRSGSGRRRARGLRRCAAARRTHRPRRDPRDPRSSCRCCCPRASTCAWISAVPRRRAPDAVVTDPLGPDLRLAELLARPAGGERSRIRPARSCSRSPDPVIRARSRTRRRWRHCWPARLGRQIVPAYLAAREPRAEDAVRAQSGRGHRDVPARARLLLRRGAPHPSRIRRVHRAAARRRRTPRRTRRPRGRPLPYGRGGAGRSELGDVREARRVAPPRAPGRPMQRRPIEPHPAAMYLHHVEQ